MIGPSFFIVNYKIVNAIRNEMASRFDIESLQKILATHRKPYLESFYACMTDITCYESNVFSYCMKLLWENIKYFYCYICQHCRDYAIRCPCNKYLDVAEPYLLYCKKKKREVSMIRMLIPYAQASNYVRKQR